MPPNKTYTCNDYREEMRLLGLRKQLNEKKLGKSEKQAVEAEIARLEKALQMNYIIPLGSNLGYCFGAG